MKRVECELEAEALSATLQSRWPDRVDPEFRAHVRQCEICRDVVALAALFDQAREDSREPVELPDAGRVWRLAQLRAHREAAMKAMAPISVTQMVAFGCAFGIAGACFGASSKWFQEMFSNAVACISGENATRLLVLAVEHGLATGLLVMLMLIVPTAIWLTASGD